MKHRRSSIACTTAAVPPTAGQLVISERGVCGGPLAFQYANLTSHTAIDQSLACVRILYQRTRLQMMFVCTMQLTAVNCPKKQQCKTKPWNLFKHCQASGHCPTIAREAKLVEAPCTLLFPRCA
jgi:hypothetical protein